MYSDIHRGTNKFEMTAPTMHRPGDHWLICVNSWRHKFIALFNCQLKFPRRVTYGKLQRFTIISHPSLNERFTHIQFYRWHHVGEFSFESFAFFLERKIFFLDIVQASAAMSYSAPEFLCECFVYKIFSTIFFFSFSVFSYVTQHTYFICAHRIEQVFWINSISLPGFFFTSSMCCRVTFFVSL